MSWDPTATPGGNKINSELANVPFEKILSGPLTAAVNASVAMAITTIDFIREVGFEDQGELINDPNSPNYDPKKPARGRPTGDPIYVTFKYDKPTSRLGVTRKASLKVPFLAMIPIPSLRVDQVYVEFNVKIQSFSMISNTSMGVDYSQSNSENESSYVASQRSRTSGFWGHRRKTVTETVRTKSKISGAVVNQAMHMDGSMMKRDYELSVKIKCQGDAMPGGLSKILDILEASIIEKPLAEQMFDKMDMFGSSKSAQDQITEAKQLAESMKGGV